MNTIVDDICLSLVEVPGEISLVIPIMGCSRRCVGCHSPQYWDPTEGVELTQALIKDLIERYKEKATCLCFMGGIDEYPAEMRILIAMFTWYGWEKKFAAYSGMSYQDSCKLDKLIFPCLDYVKLGPYRAELGGLDSPRTNQVMFKLPEWEDITYKFRH